ncbi:tripartite tricarboxylate transporter substrate binding protein [soil metagenome]
MLFDTTLSRPGASRLLAVLTFVVSCCAIPAAHAQRPYELVIPIAAGGSMDVIARSIAQAMSHEIGEQISPINKVGAGTLIGTKQVALDTSKDGRQLLFAGMPFTTLQFKKGGPAFNTADLKPVIYVGWQPTVLYVRSSIPADDFKSFLAWAKAAPQGVTFASSGTGSSPHIGAEQLAAMTGIKIVNIPMAGSSAFVPAVAGDHVDAVFDGTATRQIAKTGKLKALMVGSDTPLPDWPELPTANAVGLPQFRAGTWYGILVPASTPDAEVRKLNATLNAALKSPAVVERAREIGITLAGGSEKDFADVLRSENDRIKTLISTRGIVIE